MMKALLLVTALLVATSAAAQSLADAAAASKKAREDAAAQKGAPIWVPSVPLTTSTTLVTAPPTVDTDGPVLADPKATEVKDEQWWRSRSLALERKAAADGRLLEAAMIQYGSLASQAGTRANVIVVAEWNRAMAAASTERLRLMAVVKTDLEALQDFQEEARRAGILPGWLREKL